MIYKMTLKDSVDTMTFNLLETPIVDKDIEGAVDNVTLDGNQYTDYLYLKKQYIQKWAIMCPDEYDELRGFYTRQFEEGEVPSYRVYYGANVTRDYTFNGDYFQFNAEGIETGMTLSQLLGNAEQTTYSGKNLCPNPLEYGIYDESGVKSGSDTGSVRSTTQLKVAPSTQYIFSCNGEKINTWLYEYDANGAYISGTRRLISRTAFTTGSTTHFVTFFKGSDTGLTGYQLELGSTVTSFEPYVGGTPAPNPNYPQQISTVTGEQNIKVVGKNLVEDTISGSSIDGNSIIRSNSDFDTQVAFVMEGETYTLSYTGGTVVGGYFATKPTMNSVSIDGTRIVSNNKTFVAQYTGYFTFRTNAGESNAQCELGSTATAFEPYQGQSYTIDLGSIELAKIGNYQDRIYKDSGKWYIEKQVGKVVLDGTENWYLGQTLTNTVHFNIGDFTTIFEDAQVPTGDTQLGLCMSNYFEEKANLYGIDQVGIDLHQNKNLIVGVPNSIATTAANFKTWLSTHNTTVYYALATPTTTEITDETLLAQLNFLASLYKGANNISLVGTGAQGEMEVFIRDVMSVETDVVPEVPVRLTLTDDGVINACGCRRNVQLTMRETTE